MKLQEILTTPRVIDLLSEDKLNEIGEKVCEWFDEDVASREDWELQYKKWMELASQVVKPKNTPWKNAANIKYPLVLQAALSYNARVMPALMPNMRPVGIEPIGKDDPEQTRYTEAQKVSNHMNYQLVSEIEEWEENHDNMTIVQAITGQEYKKTYFSPEKGRIVSEFVSAADLVLHYWYTDFETARKSHKMNFAWNEIKQKMNLGIYKECDEKDLGSPPNLRNHVERLKEQSEDRHGVRPTRVDEASPHLVIDHHGWYDLDEDGYEEPYRITVHYASKKVLQISPRFTPSHVTWAEEGKVLMIKPIEYFTKYGFIPNPDGSKYDVGFGSLIGPMNAVVNSATNMMLDAGIMSIMQSGFIGKGVRMQGGVYSVQPGKWPIVNVTGGSLKDNIVPLPMKEPSAVLLQLLQFFIAAAKEIAGTTEMMSGNHPGQNTKTGATQMIRDEGLKIFNAVYKRQRRALKRELMKIFKLNQLVLSTESSDMMMKTAQLFGVTAEHYDEENIILEPSADPSTAIREQKIQRSMATLQLLAQFGGNVGAALQRVLVSLDEDDIPTLLTPPPPQPDPQLLLKKAELELKDEELEEKRRDNEMKNVIELIKVATEAKKINLSAELDVGKILQKYVEIDSKLEADARKASASTNS